MSYLQNTMNAEEVIEYLKLIPHIEGGFFRETYRSSDMVPTPQRVGGERNMATSIIYMLTDTSPINAFSTNTSDHIVYFQGGSSITYYVITGDGRLSVTKLGVNFREGDKLQLVVPANTYKAAILESGKYGLVGESLAPGFEYCDMKTPDKKTLKEKFPEHSDLLDKFCKY